MVAVYPVIVALSFSFFTNFVDKYVINEPKIIPEPAAKTSEPLENIAPSEVAALFVPSSLLKYMYVSVKVLFNIFAQRPIYCTH